MPVHASDSATSGNVLPTGEAARLIAETDWGRTSLGPRETWPVALRVLVDNLVAQPFPCILMWGPDLTQIYNEAYAVIAGTKHPQALGQPTYECWAEIAEIVRPIYDRVLAGESVALTDLPLRLDRFGRLEDAYITVAYNPARDEHGEIHGLLAVVTDSTSRVIAERENAHAIVEHERLNEQRRLALDSADLGWWHLDVVAGTVYWDRRVRELFDYEADYIDLDTVFARIHPDDVVVLRRKMADALDPLVRAPYFVEYRLKRPDGTTRWIQSRGKAHFQGEGPLRRTTDFYGTTADVTAHEDRRRNCPA
ncbi:MAG: PAS domain-containing protein [Pirellulales bacterium]